MSSFFGTSDVGSNSYFDYFYSNTSNNNNNTDSLFGNTSNFLGDYSMIQSGTYKKLLNAYYKSADTADKTSGDGTKTGESTGKYLNVKSDSESLKESLDALRSSSLYQPVDKDKDGVLDTDEKGNYIYDTDKIKENLKNFVEAYNSYLDSTSSVDTKGILRNALSAVKETSANSGLLGDIGITIGEDNKLTFDEEKYDASKGKVTTVSSLFGGVGSYGSQLSVKASATANLANSAASSNGNASSYTYSGVYAITGTSNSTLDKYL